MRISSFFFSARPLRLALEILLLGILSWLFLFLLRIYPPFSRVSSISWMQVSFALLAGPACMCWCAVRLRRFEGEMVETRTHRNVDYRQSGRCLECEWAARHGGLVAWFACGEGTG